MLHSLEENSKYLLLRAPINNKDLIRQNKRRSFWVAEWLAEGLHVIAPLAKNRELIVDIFSLALASRHKRGLDLHV